MIDKKFLVELFSKIDTIALIHTSTNHQGQLFFYKHLKIQLSKDKYLGKKKEIEIEDILKIITVCPDASFLIKRIDVPVMDYVIEIVSAPRSNTDNDKDTHNAKMGNHFLQLNQRLERFKTDLDDWEVRNPDSNDIPIDWSVVKVPAKNIFMSQDRVTVQKTKLISKVSKSRSDFVFKEKKSGDSKTGLSLLERIRLKEKFNKENKLLTKDQSKVNRYEYLNSKLGLIYEIIYEKSNSLGCQHSLRKLTRNIQDSMSYPIDESDIKNALILMSKKLSTEKVSVVNVNNVDIVKVGSLNRSIDLKSLKESVEL